MGGGVADVEGAVVGEGGLEVDTFFRGDAEAEARAEERGDGGGGDGVERVGGGGEGRREGDGSVVVDEDGGWERWVGGREPNGEQSVADGDGKGEVEGVARDAAALVEAIGLVVGGKGGEGLDEGGAGGGVEEEEVGEGVRIGGGGVLVVNVVEEGGVDGAAGDRGVGVDDVE